VDEADEVGGYVEDALSAPSRPLYVLLVLFVFFVLVTVLRIDAIRPLGVKNDGESEREFELAQ